MSVELVPLSTHNATLPAIGTPDVVDAWLRARNPNTLRGYLSDVERFREWLEAPSTAAAIEALLSGGQAAANLKVMNYVAALVECGLASATIARLWPRSARWPHGPDARSRSCRRCDPSTGRARTPGVQFLRATVQRLAQGSVSMGLESRGGRFYYYRKVWDRGRVKSEYVGSGLLALLAARMEQEDREEKEARKASEQARWDEQRERIDAVDSMIDANVVALEKAVTASLEAAGFHRQRNRCIGWVGRRVARTERGKA
jgi:hypothetical protein